MALMRIIAMINQKGGVGKTTTVANLAAALAQRGMRVALIDLDPQSHLTMHFGVEPGVPEVGVYEVLTESASLSAAAMNVLANLWLIPASIDLAGAEIELVSTVGREQLLADRFKAESLPFDYVLMDCPPSLGLLTLNALAAADEVVIPLQPHFLALQGLGKLLETVSLVQRRINPRLKVGGVVMCMFESGTRLAGEVIEDVRTFLDSQSAGAETPWSQAKLFDTRIRRNIKLAESPSFGQSIFAYAPASHGATDYDALAGEFLALHNPPPPEQAVTATPESPATAVPAPDEPAIEPAAEPASTDEGQPA
jgi:chromosome partitioning protein